MEKITTCSPLNAALVYEKASGALFVDVDKKIWFFYGEDREKLFGELFMDLISDNKDQKDNAEMLAEIIKGWREYLPYMTAF